MFPPTVRLCSPASISSDHDQTTGPLIATVARLKKKIVIRPGEEIVRLGEQKLT